MLKLILTCVGLLPFLLYAQNDNIPIGARGVAMGNASVALKDHWALYNNIGGLAHEENLTVNFSYDTRYGISEFQTYGAGVVAPLSFGGVAGINFYRFGDAFYSEQKIALGYSHKISNVSMGIKVNYLQVAIDDGEGQVQGSRTAFVMELGGVMDLSKHLTFGAHIYNLNQAKLQSEYEEEIIPVIVKAGLSYHPIESFTFNLEAEKDINYDITVKAGAEYQLVKTVYLRGGLALQPFYNTVGVGFKPKWIQFDYALSNHPDLGISHHVSLAYPIRLKK